MIAENVYLELCVCWAIFQLHWNMMKADSVFFGCCWETRSRGHSTLNGMKPFLKRFAPCCNFFAYLHLLLTAWNSKNTQVTLYTLLHFIIQQKKTFFRETSKRAYFWNQTNLFYTLSYSMSLIEHFSSFWQLWVSEKIHKIENMLISHLYLLGGGPKHLSLKTLYFEFHFKCKLSVNQKIGRSSLREMLFSILDFTQ